jgi:hypothetical protein
MPGVLGPRTHRRTVQVRLESESLRGPSGMPILFALAPLRSVPTPLGRVPGYTVSQHRFVKYAG